MAAYQAVLFDLDGTLLDTLDDLADSMNAVLASMGCPPHPVDDYRYLVGNGVEQLARAALPADRRASEDVRRCVAGMMEEYGRRWKDKTTLYNGVAALLDGLVARGLPMVVFSNKPDSFTQDAVRHFLARWPFAAVRGAVDGVPKKPDPAVAIALAGEIGVVPARVAYLGDTDTDMRTATAAGMLPVGVLWGFRGEAELRSAGARALIGSPMELLDLL